MSVHRRVVAHGYRYDVRLRTPDGGHLKRTFRTRKQAEAFHATQVADAARGTWIDPRDADRSFGSVAMEWLERDVSKRSGTLARDRSVLTNHILPRLEDRALRLIRPPDIQGLVKEWSARAQPRTVRRQYDVLRAVLTYALACDYIARTPCRDIKLPRVAALDRPIVTPEIVARVADAMGPLHGPMAQLGAVLGLRWGECAGLRAGRVDFLRSTVTVAEQVVRGESGTGSFGAPKSQAGSRTLAAPERLIEVLSELLSRRGVTGSEPDALLFTSQRGGPLDYSRWRRSIWKPACESAGVTWLTFHDLRRANATMLVAEGVDIRTAQTRLGHSDSRLTLEVYAQATSSADRSAADAIGSRYFGADSGRRAINAP